MQHIQNKATAYMYAVACTHIAVHPQHIFLVLARELTYVVVPAWAGYRVDVGAIRTLALAEAPEPEGVPDND